MDVENEVLAEDKMVDERVAKAAEDDFFHDKQILPRRSQRSKKGQPPARLGLGEDIEPAAAPAHVPFHVAIKEPATIKETLSSKHSKEWIITGN